MAKKTVKTEIADSVGEVSPEIIGYIFGGRMFTDDFLAEEIISLANNVGEGEYRIDDAELERLYGEVKSIIENNLTIKHNEQNTINEIINPILNTLNWVDRIAEPSLAMPRSKDLKLTPDALLFMDNEQKRKAQNKPDSNEAYKFGKVVLESKKKNLSLEDREEKKSSPITQILGYLQRASVVSDSKVNWGILTNGIEWRLYYQQAQSVAEQFFSVNLEKLFGFENQSDLLKLDISDDISDKDRLKCFKIFLLIFYKQSFKFDKIEEKIFHLFALEGVKLYQKTITDEITDLIFTEVFIELAKAIAEQSPEADGEQIKHATLKLLYRILFILYAEDRDLLPIRDANYYRHSLKKLRLNIFDTLVESENTFTCWRTISDLCRVINLGDKDLKVPKYNGGLFKNSETPLLDTIEINDKVMLGIILPLSHDAGKYINYKNLNVEQLGSIYEQLLEREITRTSKGVEIHLFSYARRKTGSYYTPQELVNLVADEAIEPLYERHIEAFNEKAIELIDESMDDLAKGKALALADPATAILQQKICDPAMGSGHFLVTMTDRLTDQAIRAMGEAEGITPDEWHYESPVRNDIEKIRQLIKGNADKGGYKPNPEHLKDRHIVKRMVLKSCIYGVDKNPMAVELAKLALWLNTFTVGAPLSFLDHHLKCGDSLFGLRVNDIYDKKFRILNIASYISKILGEASEHMQRINELTDAEIDQVKESEDIYNDVQTRTRPLKKLLSFLHALDWLKESGSNTAETKNREKLASEFFDQKAFNPIEALDDMSKIPTDIPQYKEMIILIEKAMAINSEENFFHWQIEFPEVWKYDKFRANLMLGGFDAVVGNPPWDAMKFEEVEWFKERKKSVADTETPDERKREIKKLKKDNNPLYQEYKEVVEHIDLQVAVARKSGIYSELNIGKLNIYKLFMEKSRELTNSRGYISLIVPSGIASDLSSSKFFKNVIKNKQLITFYDFENGRVRYNRTRLPKEKLKPFFKDVDTRFKFCIFTNTKFAKQENIKYGCFLQRLEDLKNSEKSFLMKAKDFELVNPNTNTIPIFKELRDKELIISVYENYNILENIEAVGGNSSWSMAHVIMFNSGSGSKAFKTKEKVKAEGASLIGNNVYSKESEKYFPLYKGAMFDIHNHRFASIKINLDNPRRKRQSIPTNPKDYKNPNFLITPFYWVKEGEETNLNMKDWTFAFRKVTATTNERTMVPAILPKCGCEDTVPILVNKNNDNKEYLLYANFSTIPFDYIIRNKLHHTAINAFILKQLPVIDLPTYNEKKFGDKTAEELIREIILELVYTAYNLESFAIDLGHVDDDGKAKPPFAWDEHRRLSLCAKLDAIYFILYGITEDADIDHIYSTFSIIKEKQEEEFSGIYKSLKLCKDYKEALLNEKSDIFFNV